VEEFVHRRQQRQRGDLTEVYQILILTNLKKTRTSSSLSSFVRSSYWPGAYSKGREGAGGPCPQSSIEWIFYGKSRLCWDCSLHQKCSVDLKYAKNALAAGCSAPDTTGSYEELTTLPRPSSRLGRGTPPPQSPPLSAPLAPRFSRLRRSASVPSM